jgi:hypothetical protein
MYINRLLTDIPLLSYALKLFSTILTKKHWFSYPKNATDKAILLANFFELLQIS